MTNRIVINLTAVIIAALALFILPRLSTGIVWPLIIIAALIIGICFLVRWHARHTAYQCPACDQAFGVSAWTDFMSPHLGGQKMLQCPHCRTSAWCLEVDRDEIPDHPHVTPPHLGVSQPARTSLYIQIAIILALYSVLWIITLSAPAPAEATVLERFKIPLAAGILALLHFVFSLYALWHRYRSRIYLLVTIFVGAFIALAIWIQYSRILRT